MARPLRIEFPGAWYHVLNRGRRKEKIFQKEKDYKTFLDIIKQVCQLYGFQIHAYSLLPNHYHLLISTPQGNLSKGMKHLDGVYAQKYNKNYNTDGSLFRGRYKSILVEKDEYLLELVRYIHRNAYKAGLEKEIGQYKWDSHREYIALHTKGWLQTKEVLTAFSQNQYMAVERLDSFVKNTVPQEVAKIFDKKKWPFMLGTEKFREKIKKLTKKEQVNTGEISGYCQYKKVNDQNGKEMTIKILSGREEVLQKKKSKKFSLERRALIYLLRRSGNSLKEIGKHMGGISYVSVSKQYRQAEKEIYNQQGCYQQVKEIAKKVKLQV
jgi:REP element-mobilizing transposase RayT